MTNAKYTLLDSEILIIESEPVRCYRVQSLVKIPSLGVTPGDIGGYIQHSENLSTEGACWVGGESVVIGAVKIEGNAVTAGRARVIGERTGDKPDFENAAVIAGDTIIAQEAVVKINKGQVIKGYSRIHGEAQVSSVGSILDSDISSDVYVEDVTSIQRRMINQGVILSDEDVDELPEITSEGLLNRIRLFTQGKFRPEIVYTIPNPTQHEFAMKQTRKVQYQIDVVSPESREITSRIKSRINELATSSTSPSTQEVTPEASPEVPALNKLEYYSALIKSIEVDYEAYSNDLVKVLKYPTMVDMSEPATYDFVIALRKAKRVLAAGKLEQIAEAVEPLEGKFLLAESHAQKTLLSMLSEKEKRRIETAAKLISLAQSDASTENEKRVSVSRVVKELEGFIVVSDQAVTNLKAQVGLKELEA